MCKSGEIEYLILKAEDGEGCGTKAFWASCSKIKCFRIYTIRFFFENGWQGKHGRNLVLRVPLGVRLRNHDGEVLCEINNHMEMVKILDGGKSGRGLRKTLNSLLSGHYNYSL